ncbi:DUF1573 domain-containing protein [Fulvivirga lutea]|uniref:DUF1573 domain-containing protein n=1 Tax=Fulvivirga lutea TaxID=2810512 RepID=A0A974ZZX6_9BACT|nr:DUF1573 domain-containing protein [Fulvivirga lutea]QSE96774.1 DUF1573 domain-containing protein [Fulvivirga lutea]
MRGIGVLLLWFLAGNLFAQQVEQIKFLEMSHDFGVVKEEDGPIIHEFKFTNNSSDSIQILNVKASCGCTTPAWSREPVAPGETGFIQAQYNPRNRPGRFNKSLTVTTSLRQPIRLYISGEVTPRPRTPEENYPKEIGALRFKTSSVNIGKVYVNREQVERKFEVYNQSDKPVKILEKINKPKHIEMAFESNVIPPKSITNMVITYNAGLKDDLGFMNDQVEFFTDEKENASKPITVYATIEEYFPPLSGEELQKAPKLVIAESVHDYGRIKNGETAQTSFTIVNQGQSELQIRKVVPNCSCLVSTLDAKKIKPGESTQLKVIFDSDGRRGNQQKSVTIYSNDPRASAQRVTVKAYIEN